MAISRIEYRLWRRFILHIIWWTLHYRSDAIFKQNWIDIFSEDIEYFPLYSFVDLYTSPETDYWPGMNRLKKKKPEFILHLTENIFMSILAFPSHNSQNRIIIGHTFLKSRFCCFPGKNPIEINIILEEVSVSMKRSRTRLLHELM